MKVFVSRRIPEKVIGFLEEQGLEVIYNNSDQKMQQSDLIAACKKTDLLLNVGSVGLNAYFMESCKHLKGIALTSVGYDHVDLKAAAHYGIPVSNTPDVLSKTTADTAFLLMLATSRKAFFRAGQIEKGEWKDKGFLYELGTEINGKTLGIFGLGRIGAEFARMARAAFGMHIIYNNRSRNAKAEKLVDARYVGFDELLEESDVLSVHTNLTSETQYRFNRDCFRKMKKTSIFINTARGKIHHESDLITALEEREIWGAGLDVTDPEPMLPDNPLLQMSNVCVLPHIGSATLETRTAMATMAAKNLVAVFKGEKMPQAINS
ncbi:2-hydroxyacid dehydrogenase [Sinomicrobium weinanense]|uniref:Glyoxylate/hydroxypyruvate reductase B n=1 Tax=Sinomicrobium weinanense TaxID=2842200 RepID=A0A926JUM8_9FLAO|nr:D-glycerate dehydrogenase [Sinomicrobium weinanense]MBC9797780.1 D-glycerate dehydrogenase [Sinomicrobium weinanense]MBU3122401.1 D-glycerate dehydrogenase [Sinomicrobium weinanense]